MFIAYNFFSRRDTEKLKTPLYFSRQDVSKHVSGDLEKSILKFDPRLGLLTPTHYVQFCDHTESENTSNRHSRILPFSCNFNSEVICLRCAVFVDREAETLGPPALRRAFLLPLLLLTQHQPPSLNLVRFSPILRSISATILSLPAG